MVDPQLKSDEVVTEVRYLIEDLRDLDGMSQIRFEPHLEIRDVAEVQVGIGFEADAGQLESILRRLRDRLYYQPIKTWFCCQILDLQLQIETHEADDLSGLMAATQDGLLFSPVRDYLAQAETYSRTHGELSPTELDNLNLLRQRLGLSVAAAELLNTRAAGPYRTQAEKRRHFEETIQAEFSRLRSHDAGQPIAPKDIWPVLQELAENLGLPTPEAESLYQQHRQRYQADLQLKADQQASKTAAETRLAAEARAEADRQQQIQQAQSHHDQYQALCHQALANGLYPSEFDQGRLDQARRLIGLSAETALGLEEAARDQRYGGIASAVGVDYGRLRSLLHQQAWQAADLETEAVMLSALDLDMQPITAATVQRLPALDLATIDGLWQRYSSGRFGFKAQQQVYRGQLQIQQDERQRWHGFQHAVGWRDEPSFFSRGFRPYYGLIFSLEAPPGHLPTWRWCCPSLSHRYGLEVEMVEAVMAHLNQCLPLEAAPAPALDQPPIAREVASAS
ncbi:MAG: hypothetical protein EA368_05120 [Leptolyngbya sp. DLM2.Bin27]|nr:MAG: hypothetical protein EA368_05120 [Leptolyngbya sp. DLM2.Bin27]